MSVSTEPERKSGEDEQEPMKFHHARLKEFY